MISDSRRLRIALVSLLFVGTIFMTTRWHTEIRSAARHDVSTGKAPLENFKSTGKNPVFGNTSPSVPSVSSRAAVGVTAISKPAEAPAWATPFGAEFWRGHLPPTEIGLAPRAGARLLPPQQLADAIGRVSHAFEAIPGNSAVEARTKRYRARLDTQGLSFLPLGADSEAAPIQFQTWRISRGAQESFNEASERSSWFVTGNTAQGLLQPSSGLVVHYEARTDGMQVAWVLSRAPAGEGDLLIEAGLAGAQFSATDSTMTGSAVVPRVKIGQAQAVDHSGRSWPLSLVVAGDRVKVEVPAVVLAEASFPLAVDPLLTPEFSLDSVVYGPSPSTRAAPVIAANESGYLVVWSQGRNEIADAGVYAARLDPAGVLLDPYGFVVSPIAGEQTVCAVGANLNLFLVAWAAPHGTSLTDWDILGARILPSGMVLDPVPLPICTLLSSLQNSPAAAGNGDNFLVVWRDSRSTGIYGAIVGADGVLSPTNGLSLLNGANDQYTPAVAALGTNYLVVAQDHRKATSSAYNSDIYAARVSGSGSVLDPAGFVICTNAGSQFHPAVASDGTNYLVVWQDYDPGGSDIRGVRVDPAGALLETNGLLICHAANAQACPAVASGEGGFLVAWQDYRDSGSNNYEARIYAARVQGDGLILDPDGVALSAAAGGQCFPRVATRGGDYLVVWQDFRNNPGTVLSDVYGTRGSWSNQLSIVAEGLISGAGNAEISPVAAALGTNYLAVWADNRHAFSNDWDICGVRLDASGSLLDSAPIWICTATNRQSDPTVTAGQTNFFVAWSDWRQSPPTMQQPDIFGAVVSAEGIVQQPGGIAICTVTNDQSLPSATFLGTNFFVVWQDARLTQQPAVRVDIYGARITVDGIVLDPAGFAICTNVSIQTNPAVAANASCALVVWTDCRLSTAYPDLFGSRIAADGTVLDTNGLPICTVGASSQSLPAVATDGTNFLVVWADTRVASTAPDIYGTLVSSNGTVAPASGFVIRSAPGPQTAPSAAFNGMDYLVTWQEAPSASSNAFDIFGVQVDPGGQLGPILAINTNLNVQVAPAVADGADGRFLVAYQNSLLSGRQTLADLLNSEAVPRLNALASLVDGQFQLRFRGAVGLHYAIEASDDLSRWTQFLTFTNLQPDQLISDPATTSLPARYYRAVLLP